MKRFFLRILKSLGQTAGQMFLTVVFVLLAFMAMGDWLGMFSGFSNPAGYALKMGLPSSSVMPRLLVLTVLCWGIALSAIAVAYGLINQIPKYQQASRITGICFILYGIFQIYSSFAIFTRNQAGILLAGVVYVIIGLAVEGIRPQKKKVKK
jgi:hypothetical protein